MSAFSSGEIFVMREREREGGGFDLSVPVGQIP